MGGIVPGDGERVAHAIPRQVNGIVVIEIPLDGQIPCTTGQRGNGITGGNRPSAGDIPDDLTVAAERGPLIHRDGTTAGESRRAVIQRQRT